MTEKQIQAIDDKKWFILLVSRVIGFLVAGYAVFVFYTIDGEQPSYINRFIVAPGFVGAFIGIFALYFIDFVGAYAVVALQGIAILITAFIAWSAFIHMGFIIYYRKIYDRTAYYKSFLIFIILWVLGALISIPPSEPWAD